MTRRQYLFVGIATVIGIVVILWDNTRGSPKVDIQNNVEQKTEMTLTSPVFKDGATIPADYTCNGENISPQLTISNVPKDTQSLALIVDDPDAPRGTFTHWVMWNMPADTKEIFGFVLGSVEGMNDAKKTGYTGPCPPGGEHRYFFTLYALDTTLGLNGQATKADLDSAMKGHIMEETTLIGRFAK